MNNKERSKRKRRTSRSLTLTESWDPGETRSGSKKQDGNGTWNEDDNENNDDNVVGTIFLLFELRHFVSEDRGTL